MKGRRGVEGSGGEGESRVVGRGGEAESTLPIILMPKMRQGRGG
jgi:hypothetical protein